MEIRSKRIAFLIDSLRFGGAQRQLINLAKLMSQEGLDVTILEFYSRRELQIELHNSRVKLISIDKENRWDILGFTWRLFFIVRRLQPDIIYSYLCTPNLVNLLLKLFFPSIYIVWGVRASKKEEKDYDWLTNAAFRLEYLFANYADLIIANSYAGHTHYVQNGFPSNKMVVIPNGIDTNKFIQNSERRKNFRRQWQIHEDVILIGLVGRLHPMKDYPTFLRAAALLARAQIDVKFLCVGAGKADYTNDIYQLADELKLNKHIIWTGSRNDPEVVYASVDLLTSSSAYGEGFPNVLAEAMSCEVPCVATDVGDSALIIGDTGIVVPPRNPAALSAAWQQILEKDGFTCELGRRARQRIVENYTNQQLLKSTLTAFNTFLC